MRPRLGHALLVLAFAAGCDKPRTVTVKVVNPFAPAEMKVSFRGKEVGRSRGPVTMTTIRAPSSRNEWELADDFTLTVATPCGEHAVPSSFPTDVEATSFRLGVWPSRDHVFVDNRGGPARRLMIGELAFDAAPDALSGLDVLVEHCARPIPIELDGRRIGQIGPSPQRGALVDPTGSRCYRLRQIKYGAGSEHPGDAPVLFTRALVHPLEHFVEHMLEAAPATVKVHTMDAQRHEVLEVPCPP